MADRTENEMTTPGAVGDSSNAEAHLGVFSSLRFRNFNLLLVTTTLSNAAQWLQQVSLNWLVYDITNSGTAIGTINVVRSISSIGLAPVAGVIIDHTGRRALLWMVKGWLFTISLALGLALVMGYKSVTYLYIFAFLSGIAQALDVALRQILVFDLVPRRYTPNAVALIQTGWSLMRSLGPSLGGFLILWFGAGGSFLTQAAIFVLIAISIFWMQFPARTAAKAKPNPLQDVREGLAFVLKDRNTRAFMMMGWLLPLLIVPTYIALPPIYAKEVFHGGPETLGLLMGSVGVGGIAGGVVVAALGKMERRGLLQIFSMILTCLTLIAFAFSSTLWVALVWLAFSGFFEMLYLTTNQTLLQLSIPDELRGRVTSLVNLNAALSPLGAFVAGAASDLLGGPKWVTVALCSIAGLISVLVFFFSPTVRNYRLSHAMK